MNDFQAIEELASTYFRSLHEGDIATTRDIFLPQCNLLCPTADDGLTHMTFEEYVTLISGRKSPKDAGYPCFGRVLSIHRSSDRTALLTVECAVQPRYFIDYLSLIKDKGRWRIGAKVYCVTKVEK